MGLSRWMNALVRAFLGGAAEAAPTPPPKATEPSPGQREVMASAQRMIEVVQESVALVWQTINPETAVSRAGVARQRIEDLKRLLAQHPWLAFDGLPQLDQ